MEFQEKNVLVFGSGKSGIAAAELLEKQNANIFVFEGNEKQSVAEIKEKSESFIYGRNKKCRFVRGQRLRGKILSESRLQDTAGEYQERITDFMRALHPQGRGHSAPGV